MAAGWGTEVGNLKGDTGSVGTIPDPLVVNEIHAGQHFYVGTKARFTALSNGVKLELLDGVVWVTEKTWTI